MLLRILSLILLSSVLFGCIPTYIVSNELSERYYESGEFFNEMYSPLKKHNVIFYIETGWYIREKKKLIVFFNFDSLESAVISLKKADLVTNDRLLASTSTGNTYAEKRTKFDDHTLYHGGARLAFDVLDIDEILDKNLLLKVHFTHRGRDDSISLSMQIDYRLVWPT